MIKKTAKLTTEEKWRPVDKIIREIDKRRANGYHPYVNKEDEYIDYTFNKGK